MFKINKVILLSGLVIGLAGCNGEQANKEIEIRDCQSSVFSILNSGYDKVMSDDITILSSDTEGKKMELSAQICANKNPMYFTQIPKS